MIQIVVDQEAIQVPRIDSAEDDGPEMINLSEESVGIDESPAPLRPPNQYAAAYNEMRIS